MSETNYRVKNKNSSVLIDGQPKLPTAEQMEYGEIAINYAAGHETISIKNSNNEIVGFLPGSSIIDLNNKVSAVSATTIALSAETYSHINDSDIHLPLVDSADTGKVLMVVDDEWSAVTPSVIYGGVNTPSDTLGNEGDIYLQTNPVIVYETDGTTGLLGHNQSSFADQWQLENLDLTPYRYIKCYIKASNSSDASNYTPAVVVTVPLDNAAMGPTAYMGGVMVALPFNRNREYLVSCAVDSTKTKFQVIHQNTLWDITASDANNTGRYLYKIEGYV